KTAQVRFDLGQRGEHVERTIEHLHELAELGIEVAHGTLAGVSRPGTLQLMGERVIPAVASL
ncbi:MAG TPA: LLM class F420-dependent oxidoreductase, partial [Actinomycetales bacterium]|nr:LLM class F420-dependent oxidoreductase [Actinomycetales bacterium]